MSVIQIKLNKEKIFNGNMKKPGTVLLEGQIADGIDPLKVLAAIKLGETSLEVVAKEKSEKKKDK